MCVDQSLLKDADRTVRLDALRDIVRAAQDGDEQAKEALRTVVINYRDYDPEIYSRAINRIDLFAADSLRAAALAALGDDDYGSQAWAATVCGVLELTEAEPLLLKLAAKAADCAPDLPDRAEDCPPLGGALVLRESTFTALGKLKSSEAIPLLAECLRHDSEYVRRDAAHSLSAIGSQAAVEQLWTAFERCFFRRSHDLAWVIGSLAGQRPGAHEYLLERLVTATSSPEPDLRYWAAKALGITRDERAKEALTRLANEDNQQTSWGAHVAASARKALKAGKPANRPAERLD